MDSIAVSSIRQRLKTWQKRKLSVAPRICPESGARGSVPRRIIETSLESFIKRVIADSISHPGLNSISSG